MRVVHVAPTPFGATGVLGGGERYPLELAKAVARHVETTLVTFASQPSEYVDDGLRVVVLRALHHLGDHPAQPVPYRLVGALGAADVVHAHHLRTVPTRIAAVASRVRGRPIAVTDHGFGADPLFAPLFDRFLAVSSYSASTLGVRSDRVSVIHGGVDVDRFRPAEAERDGVLYIGRLTPHKGVDVLIRSLPPGVSLTVAGSTGHDNAPPERDYPALLERLARGRPVEFVRPVPEADLPALYQRARAFVLPTVGVTCYGRRIAIPELLGLSALEAMASGTPVIASRLGGIPEIVRDGETGFLVEPGDPTALRTAIERVVGDDRLAAEMGKAARADVLDRFTWDHCARRCLAVYEELAR